MQKGKIELTQKDAENTPQGGVLMGERDGQTIIHDKGTMSGYLIGKLHKDGGIKAVNKATGQPLEMQGGEIVITAPAVSDQTKRNFEGKMMTNREILSKINSDGGGVSFADGGDIPAKIHTTDKEYEYGGKMVHDSDIANSLGMNSTLKKGKQHFSSGGKTYDVDAIYNAVKKGKLRLKTKEVPTFAMKYPVYDKQYSETVKTDFRKPNGITVRTESGEDVLIDGNHRMNNAYLKGKKTMKTYYIEDPKQIAKFTKNSKFELGGENKVGGHLAKGKSLKQIAEMHNVSLAHVNEELAKGLEVEKEHFSDFKERTRVAKDHLVENPNYYSILAKAGLKDGGRFDEGGSVSRENEIVFNKKSDRLKSFYKTNNPSIDKLLIDCQPFIAELIEKQKKLVLEQTLKINGVATPMSELDVEYYEIGLLFKMVQSFNKYLKVTDVLSDAKIQKHSDLFEISATVTRDGRKYRFYTELIPAGGYNIQEFHYRYITKTDLPESGENSAVENLKSKNTTLNKIKSIDLEIKNAYYRKQRYENTIKNGFSIYKIQGVEHKRMLDQDDIRREQNSLKILEKEIEKLKTKKTDLESVFGSLEKKGVGVNFGKEVKEVIGRKLLVDRLRASKYKETGDILEFKIETRSIRGEKISENSYRTLGQINTFTFTDEGNGLCSIKAGLELRGKYTLYAEFKNVPIRDVRLKINEIFEGEFEKYLKDGGDLKPHHKSEENLVKDAKSGNTPARDLNNYNDLMDVQADGEVGGNSGIFADGGVTPYDANQEGDSFPILSTGGGLGLSKVAYVKVSNAGSSLYNLVGNKYNSYIEFAESVEDAYKKLGKTVRSFVELEAFDENDEKLLSVSSYVSNQKNTVKNFNPLTGNYKNLEKSLQNSRPRTFQKFDWEDWLLSRVKPSTASSSTTIQTPASQKDNSVNRIAVTYDSRVGTKNGLALKNNTLELYEFLKGLQNGSFENVKIQPVGNRLGVNPIPINLNASSWENILRNMPQESALKELNRFLYSFYPDLDFDAFVKATSSATSQTTTQLTASTSFLPLDLSDTKVWIGDDERLSEAIQEVAFGLGWSWSGEKTVKYTDANYLVFNSMKFIGVKRDGREGFDANVSREINPQDILLAKKPTITTTQTPASTSVKQFDFTDTKIDVKNNPDLSLKVQKKAFEDGWEWEKGGGKTLDYNSFNYLYFTKTSISSGNTTTSFVNSPKREITEADIFGSQAPTSTTATNKSVNNDVQSVLVTYAGGQTYTALNEERLLLRIKQLWKDGGNSTMSINLQPQGNVQQLSTPLTVILDTIKTSKTSVQPSSLKNSELREYLSKDWYPELDWSYFFKEVKNTASNKDNTVDVVKLNYQLGAGNFYIRDFKTLKDLLEDFAKIEYYCVNNPDATVSVLITAKVFEKTGVITAINERIDIGKNAFKPSNFSYEEIKELIQEKWFDNQLDFDGFFRNNVSNQENYVDIVRLDYTLNGKSYSKGTRKLEGLLKNFSEIEDYCIKNPDDIVSVIVTAETVQDTGEITSKKQIINFGENAFKPRKYSDDKIKKTIQEEWFDNELNFDGFFKTNVSKQLLTDLSDTKIWIGDNPELSRRVQEKAFESGYKWSGLDSYVQNTEKKSLFFIGGDKSIMFGADNEEIFDKQDIFKTITEQDIFGSQQTTTQTPTANLVVPKTTEKAISDLDEAVKVLEKASAKVAIEYNKEVYEQSLKFLYDTKATYELALKFTPESAFMYERLDIMKKLADIEKSIKKIEDMKKGGAFFMLAKIIEKLQRGENWRMLENSEDVITNQLPQSEIDVIIRSQKFKNWFGNWEKALVNDEYDNVSKALTNGLPSVYHHGARRIKYTYREVSNGVLYLAENISYALWFSQNATAQTEEGNYLTECFVNIKNPIDLTAFRVKEIDFGDLIKYIDAIYPLANIYDFVGNQVALLVKTNQPTNIRMRAWQLIRSYAKFVNHIKENTPYDGFLYYENNPSDQVVNPATGQSEENVTKAVAIFKSHQVKVVDAVLFDGGLDDWRFENGGKLNN